MVDVGEKPATTRRATASGKVLLGQAAYELVVQNGLKKGDVLTVAQIAGIMGAKQCSALVPLCHPVPLTKVDVQLSLSDTDHAVIIGMSTFHLKHESFLASHSKSLSLSQWLKQ